jgi:predicted lipid-binding transport protein (Tim44 family)
MSVYQLGLFGGMPAGILLMGPVVGAIGARPAALIPMIGLGVVLILISIATPILSVRRAQPVAVKYDPPAKSAAEDSEKPD